MLVSIQRLKSNLALPYTVRYLSRNLMSREKKVFSQSLLDLLFCSIVLFIATEFVKISKEKFRNRYEDTSATLSVEDS